jgi:DNA-binding MarR family transcriptional regulator
MPEKKVTPTRRAVSRPGRADKDKTARPKAARATAGRDRPPPYLLEEQVGFLLRQANQRHTTIFAERMIEDLTPTQWAALAKLHERGPLSQNLLGRHTAMDAATIKGVVDRLTARGLAAGEPDPTDARRLRIALTKDGRAVVRRAIAIALAITEETLKPLSATERKSLIRLLGKIT